jgi:predicted nucleic acid-binding protein
VIVVDTNVIVYLYLPGEFTAAAEALLESDPEWAAPLLWRSELRNILMGYVRRGGLDVEQALAIQREAEALLAPGEADVDSEAVLRLAAQSGCTAYDCEFVALAQKLAVTLITMDRALLRAFPEMAQALVERKALNDLLSAAESHADMSVRPRGRARRRSDPDLN